MSHEKTARKDLGPQPGESWSWTQLGRIDRDVALVDAQPTWFSARETAVAALVEQLCHRLDATGPSPA